MSPAVQTTSAGPPAGTCPEDAQLRQFLDDACDPGDQAGLGHHLDTCDACRARIERWLEPVPTWIHASTVSAAAESADHVEAAFLARLQGWLHESGGVRPPQQFPWPEAWSHRGEDEPPQPELPGRIGSYRVLRRAGAGGMGTVYEAIDERLGRRVALKMLRAQPDQPRLERFGREAAVLAALNHPHIVPVFDLGTQDGQPFLVLEFIAGGPLSRWIGGRPVSAAEAAAAVATLARAVQYAHEQGVVHRDLKPGNVLLKPLHGSRPADNTAPADRPTLADHALMVSDFGLARWQHDTQALTRTGQPIGTPAAMAPEQARGETAIGPAADVYALGVILYELLTGRPPLLADTVAGTLRLILETPPLSPRAIQPGVPLDLETITLKCLEKEPRRRYATAAELADDLERFSTYRPIRARRVRWPGRLGRWARRNPTVAALSLVAAALLVALVAGSVRYAADQTRRRREADGLRVQAETLRALAEQRQAQAQTSAAQALAARSQTLSQLGQTIEQWITLSNRVRALPMGADPLVRDLQQDFLRQVATSCDSYLTQVGPSDRWAAAEVQTALVLSRMWLDLGRFDAAAQRLETSRGAAERLARAPAAGPEAYLLLSEAWCYTGDLHLMRSPPDQATASRERTAACLERAAAAARAGLQAHPAHPALAAQQKEILVSVCNIAARLGQFEPALAAARELIERIDQDPGTGPIAEIHRDQRALHTARAGQFLAALGRPREALDALGQGLERLDRLPDPPALASLVSQERVHCLRTRADLLQQLDRLPEALADLERLAGLLPNPAERAPVQLDRAALLTRTGDLPTALALIEPLCALPAADRPPVLQRLRTDPAFAPLRDHPDYQRLLSRLATP